MDDPTARSFSSESRAEVLIRTSSTNQLFPSASSTGNRLVRTSQAEITYLRTDDYRAAAAEALGRSANVSIGLVSDANVADTGRISFTNVDPDPTQAAEAAQTYAQAYIDSRNAADKSIAPPGTCCRQKRTTPTSIGG